MSGYLFTELRELQEKARQYDALTSENARLTDAICAKEREREKLELKLEEVESALRKAEAEIEKLKFQLSESAKFIDRL